LFGTIIFVLAMLFLLGLGAVILRTTAQYSEIVSRPRVSTRSTPPPTRPEPATGQVHPQRTPSTTPSAPPAATPGPAVTTASPQVVSTMTLNVYWRELDLMADFRGGVPGTNATFVVDGATSRSVPIAGFVTTASIGDCVVSSNAHAGSKVGVTVDGRLVAATDLTEDLLGPLLAPPSTMAATPPAG
jgi:hypothetical protein